MAAVVDGKVLPYLFAIRQAQVTRSITMITASGSRAAVPGTVAGVPRRRVGLSDDIARAIAYLVEADYLTASILPVDGGTTVA